MATNDLLQAEARERPRVAIAAAAAALLTIAAPLIVRVAVGSDDPDNSLGSALVQADHRGAVLIGAASSVLGLLAITYVADFLLRATMARNDQVQPFIRPLVIVGGIALAIFSGVLQVLTAIRIHHFATESTLTWQELKDASSYGGFIYIGIAAQLAFAIGLLLVSLNAMRVGLVTRFLGYLGCFSAVLFVLAVLPLPIVQVYWLAMLALLFWGFNRAREPPAWASGREVPWPSAAEMREQRVRAAEERRGGSSSPEPAALESAGDGDESADSDDDAAAAATTTARRKRKKRR
jgi:MFS family permease